MTPGAPSGARGSPLTALPFPRATAVLLVAAALLLPVVTLAVPTAQATTGALASGEESTGGWRSFHVNSSSRAIYLMLAMEVKGSAGVAAIHLYDEENNTYLKVERTTLHGRSGVHIEAVTPQTGRVTIDNLRADPSTRGGSFSLMGGTAGCGLIVTDGLLVSTGTCFKGTVKVLLWVAADRVAWSWAVLGPAGSLLGALGGKESRVATSKDFGGNPNVVVEETGFGARLQLDASLQITAKHTLIGVYLLEGITTDPPGTSLYPPGTNEMTIEGPGLTRACPCRFSEFNAGRLQPGAWTFHLTGASALTSGNGEVLLATVDARLP